MVRPPTQNTDRRAAGERRNPKIFLRDRRDPCQGRSREIPGQKFFFNLSPPLQVLSDPASGLRHHFLEIRTQSWAKAGKILQIGHFFKTSGPPGPFSTLVKIRPQTHNPTPTQPDSAGADRARARRGRSQEAQGGCLWAAPHGWGPGSTHRESGISHSNKGVGRQTGKRGEIL